MSLEQQIRDAYKTTLGRDVESDGSLGYWMNQGDNWQSAFQTAAAAEISTRPTNSPTLTGTQTQQKQQVANSAQQLYGRTAEQQIRDAYKTTLGRDVESDGSLGYWMNQGDNWQSAFQTAAATEISARPAKQQRLEQQRLEQQRLEQQRLEQQRLEQQRLEQQRLEQQRLEQQRLEQQRLEQQRRDAYKTTLGYGTGIGLHGGGGPFGMPTTGINLSQLQNPTGWDVQPNETVRSQLQQIIADDSPLMQQARTRALQTANSRGLLNSSMAMTAADSAMYDAAMPIATQDASTYARAGEFNSNTKNTFSRDNNQFVRDAYMADFNVQANDWAAQQQFEREYKMLDRQQQLTLERDAIQNGYSSARDQFAAQQQTIRDDKESALRLRLAQMDSSVERQRIQIDAQTQSDNVANLNALRSEYADKVFRINTSDLSPEKADKAVMDLAATYNPMITAAATKLGYDPATWLIDIRVPVKKAEADASTTPADAGMSLEQQIRDAYKTTLGRDVESDGSLGYWMNQGDNWQSAFQTAAAAEISTRPTKTSGFA